MKFSKILTTLGVTTTLVTAQMIGLPNSKLKVAQAQTTGRMMIQAKSWMNLCLDIANPEGQGPVNGASVIAFECHGGANQRFQRYNDGTIRATEFGGLCLDIANPEGQGPVNGASVIAFECHGGANQRFQLYNDGTIRAKEFGGLCLDIANPEGQGPVNGASVIAFECHGGANQRFSFVR
jgi:Ricin-type beta-trefoil lectin domain